MPVALPRSAAALAAMLLVCTGCYSPYRSDRGALVGGVGGAGVGALVGEAVGHPGVGALVGAGVGAATGAAVGGSLDQIEANNRAQIEAQLGRPVQPGAVTVGDVVGHEPGRSARRFDDQSHPKSRHGHSASGQRPDPVAAAGRQPAGGQTMQRPPVVAGQPVVVPGPPSVMYVAPQPYWAPPPPYPYYRAWRPAPVVPPVN